VPSSAARARVDPKHAALLSATTSTLCFLTSLALGAVACRFGNKRCLLESER
jgi:hypothetical protein